MREDIIIKPMTKDFLLYRCLHGGPLSRETIRQCNPSGNRQWWDTMQADQRFEKNIRFLERVIDAYGTYAILAWDSERVIGFIFFYPKELFSIIGPGGLCLQQRLPGGLADELLEAEFPDFDGIQEKVLAVYCMMTGSPFQEKNPYQRVGIGSRMARELICWAREWGWQTIETTAYEDLEEIYRVSGSAGRRFWEKLGFRIVEKKSEPAIQGEFLSKLQEQAVAQGLNPEDAQNNYIMQIQLRNSG